jgi:hypothetical protein
VAREKSPIASGAGGFIDSACSLPQGESQIIARDWLHGGVSPHRSLTDRTTKIAFDLDQLLAFYDFPGRALGASENYQSVESTPHLVALVRAGAVFHKGKLLERPIDITPEPSTAEPETVGSEVA